MYGRSGLLVLFAVFTAFFFAGCDNPVLPPYVPMGSNVLAVRIAGGSAAQARTALPSTPVAATYNISVSRGGTSLGSLTGVSAGAGSYPVQLTQTPAAGDVVTVEGFDSGNVKNAGGSYTLTAANFTGTPVAVTLYPVMEGTGNVDLRVSFDPGSGVNEITKAELSFYASLADYQANNSPHSTAGYGKSGYGSGPGWTDFTGTSPETIPIAYTGLPSGNYVVKIDFFRGPSASPVKVFRLLQAINVRGGLTTNKWENDTNTLTWNTFGSSNANLSDLTVSTGTLSPAFAAATQTYTVSLPYGSTSITITGTKADPTATLKYRKGSGPLQDSGVFTGLVSGDVLKAVVTAQDGVTTRTYAVTVTVSGLNNVTAVADYLSTATGGITADDPIVLPPIDIDLADSGGNGWADLLAEIQSAHKYVELDLSGCDITGMTPTEGEFDPGSASTGKEYITGLTLPDDATSIKAGDYYTHIFENFTKLTKISGDNVTTIGSYAFGLMCISLESVYFPKAETIGDNAFYECDSLESVNLPAATSIGIGAFNGCTSLESVTLPAVTSIGARAFRDCTSLESVDLPVATYIGNDAFNGCTSLDSVDLPVATPIRSGAFRDCTSLESVTLPVATSIDSDAFNGCTSLESVTLPVATSIGDYAFKGCTILDSVDLPAVTSIGTYAFDGNSSTTLIVTLGSTPPTLGRYIFYSSPTPKSVTVNVPSAALSAYETSFSNADTTSDNWGNGFRGGGWSESSSLVTPSGVNGNISLTFTGY
jgi:hypothetical protein